MNNPPICETEGTYAGSSWFLMSLSVNGAAHFDGMTTWRRGAQRCDS